MRPKGQCVGGSCCSREGSGPGNLEGLGVAFSWVKVNIWSIIICSPHKPSVHTGALLGKHAAKTAATEALRWHQSQACIKEEDDTNVLCYNIALLNKNFLPTTQQCQSQSMDK